MRIALRIFLLAIGFASFFGAATGRAGELIEFPNLPKQTPAHLRGYLARPDTGLSAILGSRSNRAGPYPAVVVLHGCGGISSHSSKIADQLGSWEYVALTVDSLGPRDIASGCGGRSLDQAFDAYAALRYLSQLDFIDPARVAVLGQSMGGSAALCREMVAHARHDGASIDLTVYPGAHHSFDVAELKPGIRSLGHWLEYNEPAAKDAEQKVRAFLAANLGGPSADEPAEK